MSSPYSRRWIALLVAALGLLALIGWLLVGDSSSDLPHPQPPASIAFYDRNGSLLYEALDPERGKANFVTIERIPHWLRQATVATEDASFTPTPE